jgi:hypothetical protein
MVDAARRRGPLRASSSAFLIRGCRPRATGLKPLRRLECRHRILAARCDQDGGVSFRALAI